MPVSGVGAGLGVSVGAGVGAGDGDGVGVGVSVGVGVAVGVGVGVGVAAGVAEAVGVGVDVGAGVKAGVGAGVGVGSGVGDGLGLELGVGPGPGTGGDDRFCGWGDPTTSQSAPLSFVSTTFPADPPGRRSRLDPAGWRRRRRTLDECVRGVAPADGIEWRPADRPDRQGATGRREAAGVRRVACGRERPGGVGDEEVLAGRERPGGRPGRLARDRRAGRGHVDELEPREIHRCGGGIGDLDELVGGGSTAGHDLGQEDRPGRRPGDRGEQRVDRGEQRVDRGDRGSEARRGTERGAPERDDEDEGSGSRPPDADHRRPPGGTGRISDGGRPL